MNNPNSPRNTNLTLFHVVELHIVGNNIGYSCIKTFDTKKSYAEYFKTQLKNKNNIRQFNDGKLIIGISDIISSSVFKPNYISVVYNDTSRIGECLTLLSVRDLKKIEKENMFFLGVINVNIDDLKF